MTSGDSEVRATLRKHVAAVAICAALLVVGVGGWAATTEFHGAVIAPGKIVVESDLKKIQHPTGGVVAELYVVDGQRVEVGELLVRLDETQARTDLLIISKGLDELSARQARLKAEFDGATSVAFPVELLDRQAQLDVARAIAGERQHFESRRQTREGQRAQLRERVQQLAQEVSGNRAQIKSVAKQHEWVSKELVGFNELWEKNLISYSRITGLEREKERLTGVRGQLTATVAQLRGKVLEIELQIQQIDQDLRKEAGRELAEIRAKKTELVERQIAALDLLQRVEIRAPYSGLVHELDVHTVGGVIAPGAPIMLLVPEADALTVQARVQPRDIDQVVLGQAVVVRLAAFNQQTTPEITGAVSRVSADISEDSKAGTNFYTVRIAVPESEVARLSNLRVVPGMPTDVFIQTNARTVISFLTRPLRDQITRAFREQ